MGAFKSFFQMAKFETVRVMRNKLVVFLFLLFPILFMSILSSAKMSGKMDLAIYTAGKEISEIKSIDIINENFDVKDITIVDSVDKGIELLRRNKITVFVAIDTSRDPEGIDFYYDSSSLVGTSLKQTLQNKKDSYTYKAVNEFLLDAGIEINQDYFDVVDFKVGNPRKVGIKQSLFATEVAVALSVILLLGMAYSVTKDNETNVAKNTLYLPVGKNKYLMSKLLPFVLLGIIETLVLLLMAKPFFKIIPQMNLLLILLVSIVFVTATLSIGLLLSNFKNQISTMFFDVLMILVPIFIIFMGFLSKLNIVFQLVLFALPITPYILLLGGMIYNGVVIWEYVLYLLIQTIVYYLISYLIIKKRTKA